MRRNSILHRLYIHLSYHPVRPVPPCTTCGTRLDPAYTLCFRCGQPVAWALYDPAPRLLWRSLRAARRWGRRLSWRAAGASLLVGGTLVLLDFLLWRVLLRWVFGLGAAALPAQYSDRWHVAWVSWFSVQILLAGIGSRFRARRPAVAVGWISGVVLTSALAIWVLHNTVN